MKIHMKAMPSKIKANAILIGSAGFLKPTFSSLSKAVEKNETKPVVGKLQKQTEMKKPIAIEGINGCKDDHVLHIPVANDHLHSHASTSSSSSTLGTTNLITELEKNEPSSIMEIKSISSQTRDSNRLACLDEHVTNEKQITDARKICSDLRQQIEDLKLQQKQFVLRLNEDVNQNEIDESEKVGNDCDVNSPTKSPLPEKCNNCVHEPSSDLMYNLPLHKSKYGKSNGDMKFNQEKKSPVSEDSFTLHGSMTSSDIGDISIKDEWSGYRGLTKDVPSQKVIKKLFSEREHYKKKVKRLQTALHKLKKQTQSLSRSPDLAARDIVYFNADLIGEGYMSYVYSGTIYNDQQAAIKKLIRPDMMSTSDRSYLAAEAGLLMSLHHRNIVEVYGVSTAPLQPLIITELVKGQNLHERLHSTDAWPSSPVEYYSIARDVAVGMAYLHGQKPPVLHLNLRPCNVLLCGKGHAKVTDFGFSKIRLDARISNRTNLAYSAPELLQFPVHLTTKLDVFSYAVIMWEMASQQLPYNDMSTSEILAHVSSGKRLDILCELPSGFHAIISRCWDQSPMQRPSFKEIIVLLETMTLPRDWEDEIDRSSLNRTDTKGLITPRDGRIVKLNSKDHRNVSSKAIVTKPSESSAKRERKKLSDELALESDMMTMGYTLPRSENFRNGSRNYLDGFYPDASHPNSFENHNVNDRDPSNVSSSKRYSALSPMVLPQRVGLHSVASQHHHGRKSRHSFNVIAQSPAARNLASELSSPKLSTNYSTHTGNEATYSHRGKRSSYSGVRHPHLDADTQEQFNFGKMVGRQENGVMIPEPLTDRDWRYVDQDLTVGTPEVVTGRSNRNVPKSKAARSYSKSQKSQEDIRTAVSIPYLKNLRSGDEGSSESSELNNGISNFDQKLNSYVSEACEAESRNDVNARYIGWQSARSTILNRECALSLSDQVKVQSIGTSAADRIFKEGQKQHSVNGSMPTAWSESTGSLMTAIYRPTDAQRKQLEQNYRSLKHAEDEFPSSSTSDNSFDELHRIGVLSIPSTTTGGKPHRQRHSNSESKSLQHSSSENKSLECSGQMRRQNKYNLVQRSKSWDKLKNSYSPEPLRQSLGDVGQFPQPYPRSRVALPPTMNHLEVRDRPSAFSRPGPSKHKDIMNGFQINSRKKRSEWKRKVRDAGDIDVHPKHTSQSRNDRENHMIGSSDEIGCTLRETAAELNGISKVLDSAADVHRRDLRKQKYQ